MTSNIARIQFSASAWAPVLDEGPMRAVMPIIVTLRGFDTSNLVLDIAEHICINLDWATIGKSVVAFDSLPVESSTGRALGERIGALAISISPSQPAPLYTSEGDVPDQAIVRILLEQLISAKQADREDLLVIRRREIVQLLGPISGPIPIGGEDCPVP